MSEQNIDSLCKAIENDANSVVKVMLQKFRWHARVINSIDEILNLKFDLLKKVIEEGKIKGLESYKDFFKNSDAPNDSNNQKETNQSGIEHVNLDSSSYNWQVMQKMFYNVRLINEFDNKDKVQLSDVKEAIEKGQSLNSNNGFIKICKGIYKFTYGFPENSKGSAEILSYALNQFAQNVNKWANNKDNLQYVFEYIQNIQCEDEEFTGFKKRLEYCVYDEQMKKFKVNESKTEEMEETPYDLGSIRTYPQSEEKISKKKLFLLIATVAFLVAVIFFTINLILAFLAISQTLAIILAAIATIALVIFLAIGIKNDVINKPQCLGGEKSFIDLYQNKVENIEAPNLLGMDNKKYEDKSDDDSEK